MNSKNSIILEGTLTTDPVFYHTKNNVPVCRFMISCEELHKHGDEYQKEVSYFNITAWERLAETCNTYLKKDMGIRVVGRLKQMRWKTVDGIEKSRVYVVADTIEFQSKKKGENQ